MPGRRMLPALLALLLVVAGLGYGGGRAEASQSIDPCYNWCFILHNRGGLSPQACNRVCRASPRYVCDNKCFRRNANSPRDLPACRLKCVGLEGPYKL